MAMESEKNSTTIWYNDPLLLLVGQAFFVGLAFGLLYNVAYTKLLITYGSDGLRTVYLLVGLTVPLFTIALNFLEKKIRLAGYSVFLIALFAALFFISFFLIAQPGLEWTVYPLMVVNIMGSLYCMMLRGAQAAEIFNARTIKKQYPRITGSEIVAIVSAGLLIRPLSELTGSLERLILIGAASLVIALIIVQRLVTVHIVPVQSQYHLNKREKNYGNQLSGFSELIKIVKKRYTLLVFSYQLVAYTITLLVQYLFYSEARNFFSDVERMSGFIGLARAAITALSFIFLTFFAGKLLLKFGMPLGLGGSPAGVALLLIGALFAALFRHSSEHLLFIIIIITQFADYMLYSGLTKTSVQSAFQPLTNRERDTVYVLAQGVGIPLSYAVTAFLLMGLSRFSANNTLYIVYLTLAVIVVCLIIVFFLYRSYGAQLKKTLSKKSIGELDLNIHDASTMKIINRFLGSGNALSVATGLDLLEKAAHPDYPLQLEKIAWYGTDDSVRKDVLERIENILPPWGRNVAQRVLAQKCSDSLKASAIRVLCATTDEPVSLVAPYIHSDSPEIKSAAISGLFLYGGINGILRAAHVFTAMVSSQSAQERIEAALILQRTAVRNFFHPLLDLISDEDEGVVIAALKAAQTVKHPALIPAVVKLIDPPSTRSHALAAFASFGADVEPILNRCLDPGTSVPRDRALRIIRTCSKIPDNAMGELLVSSLGKKLHPDIAAQVYSALACRGFRAKDSMKKTVCMLILSHTNDLARIAVARSELQESENKIRPLISALDDLYLRTLQNIFTLCSLIHTPDWVMGIQHKIIEGTDKQRALGNELLDVRLNKEIKQQVIAVVEFYTKSENSIRKIVELFDIPTLEPHHRIRQLQTDKILWPQLWLKTCADHAAWVLGLESNPPEENMVTIIERVLSLKSADIFSAIPDAILAQIATIAEDIDIPENETFIKKGQIGDCMYIIGDGLVSIHDGPQKIAELSDGKVVGEMAILDPEPRSASATALRDTRVLKIEKESFDSVMEDNPRIANAVIKVLCQRLRSTIT